MSDVPRPLKQEMPRYREVEEQLLQVIYKKFLGSSLTDEEAQRLKEIDDDLFWLGFLSLQRFRKCHPFYLRKCGKSYHHQE